MPKLNFFKGVLPQKRFSTQVLSILNQCLQRNESESWRVFFKMLQSWKVQRLSKVENLKRLRLMFHIAAKNPSINLRGPLAELSQLKISGSLAFVFWNYLRKVQSPQQLSQWVRDYKRFYSWSQNEEKRAQMTLKRLDSQTGLLSGEKFEKIKKLKVDRYQQRKIISLRSYRKLPRMTDRVVLKVDFIGAFRQNFGHWKELQ